MFDNDNIQDFDKLTKSILGNAEEEVPTHIWDGVQQGIDSAARRKTIVLWVRRASIAAAIAAVGVLGALYNLRNNGTIKPEPQKTEDLKTLISQTPLLAMAEEADVPENVYTNTPSITNIKNIYRQDSSEKQMTEKTVTERSAMETPASEITVSEKSADNLDVEHIEVSSLIEDDWEDDVKERRKLRASLVVSGIAGTNNPQNNRSIGPFKSTGLLKAPTKTTLEQVGTNSNFGIPISAGLGVRLNFAKKWSVGVGVNYTLLTSRFEGKYTKVENGIVSPNVFADVKNRQHYVGIPLNIYYNIVGRDFINFYAYAGGTVEKCVLNKYQILADSPINHTENAKGVQLSANIGIGVEFLIGKYVGVYIDPSLRYYFNGKQPPSIRTAQPLMLGFEVGMRFNL